MDKHAILARTHLQLLQFPVLHEQASMKFLTVTEDRLVVHKGWKSPLKLFSNPIVQGQEYLVLLQTVSTYTQLDKKHDRYVGVVCPCLVAVGASRYL